MEKGSRYVYLFASGLFLLGVVVQVFLAGMVVVARQSGWDGHIGLGHSLAAPLLLMLVSVYLGRLPGHIKRMTWLLFIVYVLQADVIIFLRSAAPLVSALHPVLALADFAIGLALFQRVLGLVRQSAARPAAQPSFETSPR